MNFPVIYRQVFLAALLLPGCSRLTRVEFDGATDRADVLVGSRWRATPWLWIDTLVGERLERGEDKAVAGAALSLRAPRTEIRVECKATSADDVSLTAVLEVEF